MAKANTLERHFFRLVEPEDRAVLHATEQRSSGLDAIDALRTPARGARWARCGE